MKLTIKNTPTKPEPTLELELRQDMGGVDLYANGVYIVAIYADSLSLSCGLDEIQERLQAAAKVSVS